MTEHTYYECDICGITAKNFPSDIPARRVREIADYLLENVTVTHVCSDCVNEIVPATRKAIKERYGANKSEED